MIENERYFRDYVVPYTNAATIITKDFRDTDELDGLFSGYENGKYDAKPWQCEGTGVAPATSHKEVIAQLGAGKPGHEMYHPRDEKRDETLQHPRCVFQIVRRHFARYTPEVVEQVCGVSQADFLAVAKAVCDNSGRDRTTAICYAVGWTQHSIGVQYIRARTRWSAPSAGRCSARGYVR